jgi:hypothetical protein
MTHDSENDREWREQLRASVDRPPFPALRVAARIAESIAVSKSPHAASAGQIPPRQFAWQPWVARLIVASAVYAAGLWTGQSFAPEAVAWRPARDDAAVPSIHPADVPFSIQASGSRYIAAVALLAELRSRLTAQQREAARAAAMAVLSGALLELAEAGDGALPAEVLPLVLRAGVRAAPGSAGVIVQP